MSAAKSTPTRADWRENYVICEHVAADEKAGTRHKGFRVCCDPCWGRGFLTAEPMEHETRPDGLCIGRAALAAAQGGAK